MLFIRSNNLPVFRDERERLRLLDALAGVELIPLIRTARRRRFEMLTAGYVGAAFARPADELEQLCAALRGPGGGGAAYTPGELFTAGDCLFFLVFGESAAEGVCAGIVYNVATTGPLAKLEGFCRRVRESLTAGEKTTGEQTGGDEAATHDMAATHDEATDSPLWETRPGPAPRGLARFIAIQPTDFAVAARVRGGARSLTRASELMEDQGVRTFLRRVQEMRREGYSPRRLFAEAGALRGNSGVSVERMFDAGLLEREVRVSCRKSGHALFDLPSPDSLAAITISKAKCSLCAAPVADEIVEETINPTWLAVSLLEDGGWLSNRVYKIVRSLGVPDSEIASGPASPHGESYTAADVCGNSFLFVTRDGDLTPMFARRVAETVAETETTHLVVVITGSVEDEGRLRLYEFAWRRARDGQDLNITLVEGVDAARREIERAFERALRHELSRRLSTLDAALGLGASSFVLDWFKLTGDARAAGGAANFPLPLFPELDQRVAS